MEVGECISRILDSKPANNVWKPGRYTPEVESIINRLSVSRLAANTPGIEDFLPYKPLTLGRYMIGVALPDQDLMRSVTFVMHDTDDQTLVAFSSITMLSYFEDDPTTGELRSIPVIGLDRLERTKDDRYKGIGRYVLDWTFDYSKRISDLVGGVGLYLEAANDELVEYYKTSGLELLDFENNSKRAMFCRFPPNG